MKKLHSWAIPLGLLVLMIISFGLLIPWLGFYWDDWSVLITHHMRGIQGFWEYYQFDRPVSAWTLVVSMPFLGTNPVNWHIFTLLLRWGTTLAFWWTLLGLWPKRRLTAALTVFLFAVYPIFKQQAISVAYSQHWTCYLLYSLSMGLMVWALRTPKRYWLFTTLAFITSVVQMTTMEYFVGLELLRPIVLWIMVAEQPGSFKTHLKRTLAHWTPYLVGLVGCVIWRLFLLKLPVEDPNTPTQLYQFLSAPLGTLAHLVQLAAQDLAFMLVTVWGDLFKPENISVSDSFILFSWGVGLITMLGLFFFFRRLPEGKTPEEEQGRSQTAVQAMILGGAAILFGVLPIWLTNRQVMSGQFADRFGLPAMLGASLFFVGLIQWLVNSRTKQILLIVLFIGLSVSQQLRTDNDFRWAWVKQTRFYWQLSWRAPALQPQSAIFSDGEIFSYMGANATTAAIDILYPNDSLPSYVLPYYFYSLGRDFAHQMPGFQGGMPVHENNYRIFRFNSTTKNAIIIDYDPARNNCLHVLTPDDASVPDLAGVTVQALPNANLSLIQAGPTQPGYPNTDIYGPEPDLAWCQLFQKADLARQLGDWQQVTALGDQAAKNGFSIKNSSSNTPYEWLPFIEGYARTGQMQNAMQISEDILARDSRIHTRLCTLWKKINQSAADADLQKNSSQALQQFQCAP